MNIEIEKIKITERHRKDLGDINSLAESIKDIGLLHPIVVNQNNELISGRRRLEAFKLLGRTEIPATQIDLVDIIKGEYSENAIRKDFLPSEAVAIWQAMEKIKPPGKKLCESYSFSGNRRERASKMTGLGVQALSKAKQVVDSGNEEIIKKMDLTGNVDKAYREIKMRDKYKELPFPPLPNGKFNVIYADPPWRYEYSVSDSRTIENHYHTLELETIKKLEVPSADDAVLFLWSPAPKIKEALEVMEAWGFVFRTTSVWDKEIIGNGYWFRNQHEILLVGIKGNFKPPFPENRPSSVYREKRTQHSKKPEYYYEMIEKMYPNYKYLELFARTERDGWVKYGV